MSRRVVVVITAALVSGAIAASTACDVFTRETCRAADIIALSGEANATCSRCLERAATCDTVGNCVEIGGDCTGPVRAAHACVQNAAASSKAAEEEGACTKGLVGAARDTYDVMRASCGRECALPVCKVDPAAVSLGSPDCDRCITSACCEQINACYGNRTCKLVIECIAGCPNALTGGPAPPPGHDPCADDDDGRRPPGGDAGLDCVDRCLAAYADHELRQGPDAGPGARCLAYSIRTCALGARCADRCDGGF